MRIGEICALNWGDVDLDARFLRVRGVDIGAGKSLAAKREVALTSEAIRILRQMTPNNTNGHQADTISDTIFNLTPKQQDSNFRKAKKQAGITNLTFHDSKHEAITRLAQKLLPLELAKMVGHKDLKITMRYYNPTGAELAAKLD
jgi:integrase